MPASSTRRPGRRPAVALALAAGIALAGLAGCGDDTPPASDLVAALRTSGIPKAEAECVVDAVEGTLDASDIEALVERGPSGAPRDDPAVEGQKADRLRDAVASCRDLATTSTTSASVPIDDDVTTTTATVGGTPSTRGDAIDTTSTAPD